MNAKSLLNLVAKALNQAKLEVVMIGNAAAALQGAPVTTLDIDFMFRKTPLNLQKLKRFARSVDAVIFRPYYPTSSLFRVVSADYGLQVDFMSVVHGVKSFASLRSRAEKVDFDGNLLLVASLSDIIKSKKVAARPQDLAILPILERTQDVIKKKKG